ncbi:MAG: hypothetical protein RMJ84_12555 [Sandaracinaceae bacterium]|nr:hypothetical protein [Sandaracinaceae bacterium]
MKRWLVLAIASLLFSLAFALVFGQKSRVAAVSTRAFEFDDASSFAGGELRDAAIRSSGEVVASVGVERVSLPPEVGLVLSVARGSDGVVYLGTDDNGRIYRVLKDRVELFAETGQLLVTAMALAEDGTLYAATLPEVRIHAITTRGPSAPQVRELVSLAEAALRLRPSPDGGLDAGTVGKAPDGGVAEGIGPAVVEAVWDLLWDGRTKRLYAATGPEGQLFAIDTQGQVSLLWDAPAAHLLSLALAEDGSLFVGTSDDAVVARVRGPGRVEIVWDFPGNEITALAQRDGILYVASNEFSEPPPPPPLKRGSGGRAQRPRPGKGRVWLLGAEGRPERIWSSDEAHVTRLEAAQNRVLYAALGQQGRIVRIEADRSHSIWIDVDERQVLALGLTASEPFFITGDGAAFYRVRPGIPSRPQWTSKVLDAEFTARWGGVQWRGSGRIEVQGRSGNTERPDENWSAWSAPIDAPGPLSIPPARFVQLRVTLASPDAVLRALTLYYLPQNQRPVLSEVTAKVRRRQEGETPLPSPQIPLSWKVDNPDGDRLRFRLRFREETQSVWRDILREGEVLSSTEYNWNTIALPDGYYVVEVEASDEPSNPDQYILRSRLASEPILVDNTPPQILDIEVRNTRIRGRVRDGMGPITRLEISIDGGEYRLIFPEDELFDSREERFDIDVLAITTLARFLVPGSHIASIRAFDAAGNSASAELSFTIPQTPTQVQRGTGR